MIAYCLLNIRAFKALKALDESCKSRTKTVEHELTTTHLEAMNMSASMLGHDAMRHSQARNENDLPKLPEDYLACKGYICNCNSIQ